MIPGKSYFIPEITEILIAAGYYTSRQRYRYRRLASVHRSRRQPRDLPEAVLTPSERAAAQVEGWILGVPGLIREPVRDHDGILGQTRH
jgi:hypothetical protein